MRELMCAHCKTPVKDLLEDRVPIYNPKRVSSVEPDVDDPWYRQSRYIIQTYVDSDTLVCAGCLTEWWDYNEADNLIEMVDPSGFFEPADLGEIEEALGLVGRYTGR